MDGKIPHNGNGSRVAEYLKLKNIVINVPNWRNEEAAFYMKEDKQTTSHKIINFELS